jgi:hypothetical protein
MDTPGYDPVSATGQVAGGANMIVFTTGRGSAYGCAPSPSLKLSTNTTLWVRQEEDIDLNCGEIADGSTSVDEVGERLFQLMLATASGTKTKSERHGYGQSEFVPWYVGGRDVAPRPVDTPWGSPYAECGEREIIAAASSSGDAFSSTGSIKRRSYMKPVAKLAFALFAATAFVVSTQAVAQEKLTVWWVRGFYKSEDDALFAAIKKVRGQERRQGRLSQYPCRT